MTSKLVPAEKPTVTKTLITNSKGENFQMVWDETNNTIHLTERDPKNSTKMYDFEQTRGIEVSKFD